MGTKFVGVDIGGTFTDVVMSQNGHITIHKQLSTPHNPAQAMLAGLATSGADDAARVSHGSTVATNAILERKGAKTALITTQGFRDVLAIGRQNRPNLYALHPTLPSPLIPRHLRYEVPERLDATGKIITPLDIEALDAILDALQAEQVEAVAICFLFSFLNDAHEQATKARLVARGIVESWQISLSCQVSPQFREYERTSTTALDAYVRPVMNRYLSDLESQLNPDTRFLVMKSSGGVIQSQGARQQAIHTALSGPAAGVLGAFYVAKQAGYHHILTLDMGGTSTDVAVCPGYPLYRPESEIDGLPLRIPLIDIETVGAGGGSLARLDAGGGLQVGPQSAGADPGPIVYGQGGQMITVSDANAVLGRLDADHFLGGAMTLHLEPAQTALNDLGQRLGSTPQEAALGVVRVANINIDRALRRVSIERGYDPRDFTLMAFGGAGALHACEVAEGLGIPRVLVPRYPGMMCALGLLVADVKREYTQAILQPVTPRLYLHLQKQAQGMIETALSDLSDEGISAEEAQFSVVVDVRYIGQSFELTVPFDADFVQAFHTVHQQAYGHATPSRPIEVVNLRLEAIGPVEKPTLEQFTPQANDGSSAIIGHKNMPFSMGEAKTSLYERDLLQAGAVFSGAALIFQTDSTTLIPPGWMVEVDPHLNLILTRD